MRAPSVVVDLDGALGDTHPLWEAFLADAARRLRRRSPRSTLPRFPADRGASGAELDRWAEAGVGDWRRALVRFAEETRPCTCAPTRRERGASSREALGAPWSSSSPTPPSRWRGWPSRTSASAAPSTSSRPARGRAGARLGGTASLDAAATAGPATMA